MSEQTTPATPEQQNLYWFLAENVTKAATEYLAAKDRYDEAKAALETLSCKASEAAAEAVGAKTLLEQFEAESPGITFKAFRPDHIDAAFSDDVQTWEL